jgi:hypothetical protein
MTSARDTAAIQAAQAKLANKQNNEFRSEFAEVMRMAAEADARAKTAEKIAAAQL